MATSSTDFVQALGGGSGIDTKALSKALAEAQVLPRKTRVEGKIDTLERRNSGYSALTLALNNLKGAFDTLKDKSTFGGVGVSNSHTENLAVTAGVGANQGTHEVVISALAKSQRSVSGSFASADTSINGGAAMTLTFTFGDATTQTVSVPSASATPAGLVKEINDADIGVTAQLVDTGDPSTPYKILLTGLEGADSSFVVSTDDSANPGSPVGDLDFDTTLQSSRDATLTYQGLTVSRSSNVIDDLIEGATIQLLEETPVGETASVTFTRDTSAVKAKLMALVDQYNQTVSDLAVLAGEKSDDEEDVYSGSLNGDSLVTRIKGQLRSLLVSDSSTPSGELAGFWQLGFSIDRNGVASINEATLDTVLQTSFEDVRTLFSADTDDQSVYSSAAAGIAGDASKTLFDLVSYRGPLATGQRFSDAQLSTLATKLEDLEKKLEDAQQRYLRQFARMEEIVSGARASGGNIVSSIGQKQ